MGFEEENVWGRDRPSNNFVFIAIIRNITGLFGIVINIFDALFVVERFAK